MPRKAKPAIDSMDDLMEAVRKQQAKTRQVIEETKAWLAEQEAPDRRTAPSRRRSGSSGTSD